MQSRNHVRAVVAHSAVAALLASAAGPASAQQTVDDLRAVLRTMQQQMEALQDRIDDLEGQTDPKVNKQLTGSGKDKVRLTVSGQVNRAVLYFDDDVTDDVRHVDNDNSSTRVRWDGRAFLTDNIAAGAKIEVQFESNSTAAINQRDTGAVGPNNFTERKLEFFLQHESLGTVFVGQGDTASNGTSEVDLSGTTVVAYSGIADMAGGLSFRNSTTGGFGERIGRAWNNMDGLSRDDRIRYDTPKWNGFQLATSHVDQGEWDVAAKYSGKFHDTRVAGAIAYANANSTSGFDQLAGSASVLFPAGLSLTVAAGEQDHKPGSRSGDDADFWYVKGGYEWKALQWGPTAVSIDYGETDSARTLDNEITTYGFALVQDFKDAATELYFAVRNHELDTGVPGQAGDFDDIFTAMAGARLKF